MKQLTLFFILLVMSASSNAVLLLGPYNCGEWFEVPASKAWLYGYLSGLNVAHTKAVKPDFLPATTSGSQISLWMDNYCKANPLSNLHEGSLRLYIELMKKANSR